MTESPIPPPPSTSPAAPPREPQAALNIPPPPPPEPAAASKKTDIDDDPMVTVAGVAAVADTVEEVVGDGDGEASQFIFWLSLAGLILSYLAITHNPGEPGVIIGVGVYVIGYLILLSGLFAFYLIGGGLVGLYMNLFEDGDIPYLYLFGALGVGALLMWLLSLVPKQAMRNLRIASWLAMFAGPAIMIMSGANITGSLCIIVSILWLILFIIGMTVNCAVRKVGNAIDSAIDRRLNANKNVTPAPTGVPSATAAAAPVRRLKTAAPIRKVHPVTPALHQKPAEHSNTSTTE